MNHSATNQSGTPPKNQSGTSEVNHQTSYSYCSKKQSALIDWSYRILSIYSAKVLFVEENQSVIFKVNIFNFIFKHIKGSVILNFTCKSAPEFYCLIKKETFIGVNLDWGVSKILVMWSVIWMMERYFEKNVMKKLRLI